MHVRDRTYLTKRLTVTPLFLEAAKKSSFAMVHLGTTRIPCRMGFGEGKEPFVAFVPTVDGPIESVAVLEADYSSADPEEGVFSDIRSRVLFKDGAFHAVGNVRIVFFVAKNYLEIRNKTGA